MKNTFINREIIKKVASTLGDLNNQVIYVGGATVSLYVNDPAADDVRPTKDIDISVSVATINELEEIRENLVARGFIQSADLDVICRFKLDDILIDVMNTDAIAWAPANPWFKSGFENLEKVEIDEVIIQIMPLTSFLASKFSAYDDRGGNDPRFSHDIEDISYILDNRTDWHTILKAEKNKELKAFLIERLEFLKKSSKFQEAILGNLFHETSEERFKLIMKKIDLVLENE